VFKQDKLKELISDSQNIGDNDYLYGMYESRVRAFIKIVYDKSELERYNALFNKEKDKDFKRDFVILTSTNRIRGYLEGLLVVSEFEQSDSTKSKKTLGEVTVPLVNYDTKKVFIVHGRDNETKETVARFVQKIGLKPIILHEQPNSGLTIIEKLEAFSNVGFAVVLLTPDDIGGLSTNQNALQARARQNVILELGYFIGKLSRNRICALYKQGVEIPSDYGSVVFIELDEKGGWRTKLAQEFVHAGMSIEIEGLLET